MRVETRSIALTITLLACSTVASCSRSAPTETEGAQLQQKTTADLGPHVAPDANAEKVDPDPTAMESPSSEAERSVLGGPTTNSTDTVEAVPPGTVGPQVFAVSVAVVPPQGEIRRNTVHRVGLLQKSKHPEPTLQDLWPFLTQLSGPSLVIEEQSPGEYWLGWVQTAPRLGHTSCKFIPIEIADQDIRIDLAVPPIDPEAGIDVTLIEAGKILAEEATFRVRYDHTNQWEGLVTPVAELGPGRYFLVDALTFLTGDKLVNSRAAVEAKLRDGRVLAGAVSSAPGRKVTIDFSRAAEVQVRASGIPQSWPRAFASIEHEATWLECRVEFDDDGIARFPCVPLGDCQLRVLADYYVPGIPTPTVASRPVSVMEGENQFDIKVPELHTVTVTGIDQPEGSLVYLINEARHVANLRSGQAEFHLVEAGSYQCVIPAERKKKGHSMRVQVPARGNVEFTSEPPNALLVWRHPRNSQSTGLIRGDILAPAPGEEFNTFQQSALAWRHGYKVRLLRSGKFEEFEFDQTKSQRSRPKEFLTPVAIPES